MSLRLNLYGCKLNAVTDALGSGDSSLLNTANEALSDVFSDVSVRSKAAGWLRTLINDGYALATEREPPSVAGDGGLLVSHLETEIHVFAVHSIVRAVSQQDWLDLAGESSTWNYSAISALSDELRACHFTRSGECSREFLTTLSSLSRGTPLFGDDFRTDWSFYAFIRNHDFKTFIAGLGAAIAFERQLPDAMPDHLRQNFTTRLSDDARAFAEELSSWLASIADAGQDAYVIWW